MKYINKSKERKLISINREKKWVDPGEIIDINQVDIRLLGVNSSVVIPFTEKMARRRARFEKRKAVRIARIKARQKRRSIIQSKKNKTADVTPKKNVEKKVKEKTLPNKKQINSSIDRKKLKDALSSHTKANIIEIGNRIGVKLNIKDKKDVLIDSILKTSKEKGYAAVLKKI